MQWVQAQVHTTTAGADLVSQLLMELGSAGTEIVDRADIPDPTKPGVYWELYDEKLLESMPVDVLVRGWFPLGEGTADVLAALRGALAEMKRNGLGGVEGPEGESGLEGQDGKQDPEGQGGLEGESGPDGKSGLGSLALDVQDVEDKDWAENWKQFYKPFRIGSHLVVKPTWERYAVQPGDVLIELDPGMAFGTGTHETTHMCMELLEKHLRPGLRVMDVGAGSGILAIAAAKLGADPVLAIDIDPDAVKVAAENVALNGVGDRVRVICGDLVKSQAMPCDVAVANIVADAICLLAGPLTQHLEKGGLLLCSGIIREREPDVLAAAQAAGYKVAERLAMGEWVALCLQREA